MGKYEANGKEVSKCVNEDNGGHCVKMMHVADVCDPAHAEFLANAANARHSIDKLVDVSIDPGNAHANHYMRGMANGMLVAQSCYTNETPKFIEADVVFDYMREADSTNSTIWRPQNVHRDGLIANLRSVIELADVLNLTKKLLVRGKSPEDLGYQPVKLHESLAVEFDPMNTDEKTLNVVHGALGVITEAGEIAEMLLSIIEGKPIDDTNVIEESGDVRWYLARMLRGIGKTDDDCERVNISKLRGRHGATFNAERDWNRDLAAERKRLEADAGTPLFERVFTNEAEAVEAQKVETDKLFDRDQATDAAEAREVEANRLFDERTKAGDAISDTPNGGENIGDPKAIVRAQMQGDPLPEPRTADMDALATAERAGQPSPSNVGTSSLERPIGDMKPVSPGGIRG